MRKRIDVSHIIFSPRLFHHQHHHASRLHLLSKAKAVRTEPWQVEANNSDRNQGRVILLFRGVLNAEIRMAEFKALVRKELGWEVSSKLEFSSAITSKSFGKGFGYHDILNNHCSMSDTLLFVDGLPSREAVHRVVSQCMLVKAAFTVWAQGGTFSDCAKEAGKLWTEEGPQNPTLLADFLPRENEVPNTWAVEILPFTVGQDFRPSSQTAVKRGTSTREMVKKIDGFADILDRFPGDVSLKSPDQSLAIIEEYSNNGLEDRELKQITFAQKIAKGAEDRLPKFSLSTRAFVGRTSMKPRMAFVMSNLAGVRDGHKVLDPFVGSGSLLLSASALGATELAGVDIDPEMVQAGSDPEQMGMAASFLEQGLSVPSLLLNGDAGSKKIVEQLEAFGPFDAIITDPPYGKREGGLHSAREDLTMDAFETILKLCLNDQILKVGGTAVFMLPLFENQSKCENALNVHPSLVVKEILSERVNSDLHRWIVVVEKAQRTSESLL